MNRSELKASAKASLKGKWGTVIGASLVIGATFMVIGVIHTMMTSAVAQYDSPIRAIIASMCISMVFSVLYALGSSVFVGGYNCLLLNVSRNRPAAINDVFSRMNQTVKFFMLSVITGILVFLWSLLLFIPGIIAVYRYSQAYFILSDNPEMGVFDAISLSKELMHGHKMEYFVLYLSFFGWLMLSSFTLGIGLIWLMPYMNVTFANFYNKLMAEHSAKQATVGSN